MAILKRASSETTPLLPAQLNSQLSSETLAGLGIEGGGGGGQRGRDQDAANQSVGKLRALLIILSLWVLIFLQGRRSLEIPGWGIVDEC